jgi:hypothetical protein
VDGVVGGRVEGFAIRLTGSRAKEYNIHYFGHLANIGDTRPYSDGEFCGTRGESRACEGLRVWLTKRIL